MKLIYVDLVQTPNHSQETDLKLLVVEFGGEGGNEKMLSDK